MMEKSVLIKWKKVEEEAVIPKFCHEGDAGADLASIYTYYLEPGDTVLIDTGLQVEVPAGYELQIRPRSGLSLKTQLIIPNSPGTIDSGYRGNVRVIVRNTGQFPYTIQKGQKIAQAVIAKLPQVVHIEVNELSETTRGEKGFGSTSTQESLF